MSRNSTCPACGTTWPAARFCGHCGARLPDGAGPVVRTRDPRPEGGARTRSRWARTAAAGIGAIVAVLLLPVSLLAEGGGAPPATDPATPPAAGPAAPPAAGAAAFPTAGPAAPPTADPAAAVQPGERLRASGTARTSGPCTPGGPHLRRWELQLSGAGLPAVTIGDGAVIAAEPDGTVTAIEVGTGRVRWRVALGAPARAIAGSQLRSPLHETGPVRALAGPQAATVAVLGGDGRLTALGTGSGRARWTAEGVAALAGVVPPWLLLERGGALRALGFGDGEEVWRHPLPGGARATVVASHGASGRGSAGRIAVAAIGDQALVLGPRSVTSLHEHTGQVRWRAALPAPAAGPPLAMSGVLVVPTRSGTVVALDSRDGQERMRVSGPAPAGEQAARSAAARSAGARRCSAPRHLVPVGSDVLLVEPGAIALLTAL